jgi:hypothetical protein
MYRLALAFAAALAVSPSIVGASCGGGGDCAVGGIGNGGAASEGKAQGSHLQGTEQGASVTNSGNADAGRLNITGADNGSLSGTFRSGIVRGRTTGFFGDCTGLCGDLFDEAIQP